VGDHAGIPGTVVDFFFPSFPLFVFFVFLVILLLFFFPSLRRASVSYLCLTPLTCSPVGCRLNKSLGSVCTVLPTVTRRARGLQFPGCIRSDGAYRRPLSVPFLAKSLRSQSRRARKVGGLHCRRAPLSAGSIVGGLHCRRAPLSAGSIVGGLHWRGRCNFIGGRNHKH
jgi:hypothetical protein